MLEIKNDLEKIKDYLYEAHLEVTMNTDFGTLIKLKSINEELRETLILMYSNHKAEFQAVKNHNFRILLRIVDTQSDAFDKVIAKQLEMSKILDTSIGSKEDKKATISRILTLLAAVASFIVVIFLLFASNKEVGEMVIDLVKSIVPKIL